MNLHDILHRSCYVFQEKGSPISFESAHTARVRAIPISPVQSMVRLRTVRSLRARKSRRKKQIQASLRDLEGPWAVAGQVPAELRTFTDDTTFGGMDVHAGVGRVDRSGRFLLSEKSDSLYPVFSSYANWRIKDYRSLEAYFVWSGPGTTLQAFQGKLTSVDRKTVPALSGSYEQFCDVFNAASPPKQQGVGILISPNECFLHSLKCMLFHVNPAWLITIWVGRQCVQPHPGGLWNQSSECTSQAGRKSLT